MYSGTGEVAVMNAVIRIAAIGLVSYLAAVLLKRAGREDIGAMVTIAGLAAAMLTVIGMLSELLTSVRAVFGGYWQ